MSPVLKAALIAPVVFTLFIMTILAVSYNERIMAGGDEGVEALAYAGACVLLAVNVHVFVLGAPCYYFLKKRNALTKRNVLLSGFAVMGIPGLILSLVLHSYNIMQVLLLALLYGLMGVIVSDIIWRIGFKK